MLLQNITKDKHIQLKLLLDGGPDVGVNGAGAAVVDDLDVVRPIRADLLKPIMGYASY